MARSMVTKWGLYEKLGPMQYEDDENDGFLGRPGGPARANMSAETSKVIDEEIKQIIDHCYGTARQILTDHREQLDAMAAALLEYETIDKSQIDDIMAGKAPKPPANWTDDAPSSGPSDGEAAPSSDEPGSDNLDAAPSGA